jgi:hypothetical protein
VEGEKEGLDWRLGKERRKRVVSAFVLLCFYFSLSFKLALDHHEGEREDSIRSPFLDGGWWMVDGG